MKHIFKLILLFLAFTVYSGIATAAEEDNIVNTEKIISEINKLQTAHLSILHGNSLTRMVNKSDTFLSEPWSNKLRELTKSLVKDLKVGKSIFDYPGLLGCGRIVSQKDGYFIEMYNRTKIIGDSNNESIERHIIYFSNEGIIKSIGRSMPFSD